MEHQKNTMKNIKEEASHEDLKRSIVSEKEKETLAFWKENKIFEKSVKTPAGQAPKGQFAFYDGPPFATGLPHHGTIMAGTVKDLIPRYRSMKGESVRRVWGWDCHGLPIENLVEKKLNLTSKKDIEEYGIGKFNHEAYKSVLQYEEEWKKTIPRVGRWVDMEHSYKTMDATYTESVWWSWKELFNKGLAYEGYKIMHICPRCETPLAQSEVGLEYNDVTDISVTVEFELVDEPGVYVLAWTTTPWTLPGNTALALHKDIVYVKVKSLSGESTNFYVLAKSKVKEYFNNNREGEIVDEFTGDKLIGKKYKPVFSYFIDKEIENKKNIWKIWHADFITEDSGTSIAHEAPAFGTEDMELAKVNGIPVIKHIKMDGTFTSDVTDFAGMKVKQKDDTQSADIEIVKWLAHNGKLFEKHKIVHSYPLCWRCKTPLLNYATSSWFVDVPKMKDKILSENAKIGWVPEHIRDGRFGKWLEGAREWAVSRTRYWGAPLPVWKSDSGKLKVIGSLKELAEHSGVKQKNTYLVMRHGESLGNTQQMMDKGDDPNNHLSENGMRQACDTAQHLKNKKIDIIIHSPVIRAKETAEIVAKEIGVDMEEDSLIREYDMGIFSGKNISEYMSVLGDIDYLKLQTRPEGGETHQEMMNRVMKALSMYEDKYSGKTILLVTHGGPIRMMVAGANLLTEEDVIENEKTENADLYPKNAEVREIKISFVPRDDTGAVNLHRPYIDEFEIEIEGEKYKRIPDVFDCWYESGAMPFASIHYPFENKEIFKQDYPADFIAESLDQTRGWFYSLINLGVGLFGQAPYQNVICNGMINGDDGQKISKSLGNYTDPMLLIDKFGADSFRYYMMSSPIIKGESTSFKDDDLEDVYKKLIMRLDNVVSLYEMNKPEVINVIAKSKDVLDRWIVSRVHEVVSESTKGYDAYKIDEATRPVVQFIDDLSVWYVRRARSRLKGDEGEESKNRTFAILTYTLNTLSRTIAPVMPFLAERVYKAVGGKRESVHLESWPEEGEVEEDIIKDMRCVREAVKQALMIRNKENIPVRQPLASARVSGVPSGYFGILQDEINVEEVFKVESKDGGINIDIDLKISPELQRKGDVRNLMRAIQDMRKEKGLSPKDMALLLISEIKNFGDLSEVMRMCKLSEIKERKDLKGTSVSLSFGSIEISLD